MTFPIVQSVTTTAQDFSGSARNYDLPATINSGDLLVLMIAAHRNAAITATTPSGWTQFGTARGNLSISTNQFYRVADGTEGSTVSVTWSVNHTSTVGHCLRITGHGVSQSVSGIESSSTFVTTASQDPPALTPSWGSDDTLWITGVQYGDDPATVLSWPTGYSTNGTDTQADTAGNASGVATSYRDAAAASENPGIITLSQSQRANCFTVAIQPTAGGADYSEQAAATGTSAATAIDAYSAAYPEQVSATAVSAAIALDSYAAGADYSEQAAATGTSAATAVDAYSATYPEQVSATSASAAIALDSYAADYTEQAAASAATAATAVESYAAGANYFEIVSATGSSSAAAVESYDSPPVYSEIAVAIAVSAASAIETPAADYTELAAATAAAAAVAVETYGSPPVYAELVSATAASIVTAVHTYSSPTLAAAGIDETMIDELYAEFGESAVYTPLTGLARSVTVIVDVEADSQPDSEVQVRRPLYFVSVRKNEVEAIARGDQVSTALLTFTVDGAEPINLYEHRIYARA